MPLIDALAHVGLPRYLNTEDFLRVMDDQEAEAAVLCAASACADLAELSRAACRYSDRLRTVGIPVGPDRALRLGSVAAQLRAGFCGIFLTQQMILEEPELLHPVGSSSRAVFVAADDGLEAMAPFLLGYLADYPDALVGLQGGGPTELGILSEGEALHRLLRHPRCVAILPGQGESAQVASQIWAQAIAALAGWDRMLFGSGFPHGLWRGESYRSATVWIDKAGLAPSQSQREAFSWRNARRLFFEKPLPACTLQEPWPSYARQAKDLPVQLSLGPIELPQQAQQVLLSAYLRRSGPGSYRDFISEQLAQAARSLSHGGKS